MRWFKAKHLESGEVLQIQAEYFLIDCNMAEIHFYNNEVAVIITDNYRISVKKDP